MDIEHPPIDPIRRRMLRLGGALAGGVLTGGVLTLLAAPRLQAKQSIVTLLEPPDGHGLRLRPGLRARVVARSGEFPPGTSGYRWHEAPDGGAVFPAPDGDGDSAKGGGWVYVSNSESRRGKAGAGALRFDAGGNLVSAYPILTGTERNCAGGATPWGTWLSCEEHSRGRVWECDPFGQKPAVARPALGVFAHEAAAVDPVRGQVYLTEDIPDGLLYRFTPTRRGDLSQGRLEGAFVKRGSMEVRWIPVPDPLAKTRPTRRQLSRGTIFNRSEGIVHYQGRIVFATTGDHRLWSYDIAARKISVLYDARRHPNPSGTRLYFSSQRGAAARRSQGVTYEISGLELG